MIVNIYALAGHLGFNHVYYSLGDKAEGHFVVSPIFEDKETCLQSIRQTILWLRDLGKEEQRNFIRATENGFSIHLFDEKTTPFIANPLLPEEQAANDFVTTLRKAAQENLFTIHPYELFVADEAEKESGKKTLEDIAAAIDALETYQWISLPSFILDLSKEKKSSTIIAAAKTLPSAAVALSQPCAPLFNLLRPYGKKDLHRFFGRTEETDALYEQTFDSRLLVVHGEKSVGKTSLVQCGLLNRFKTNKWQDIYIRRWFNINDSLKKSLHKTAKENNCATVSEETRPMDILRSIYQLTFQPVLLVFDQLEELFSLPYNVAEQQQFFLFLQELIQDTTFPAKVILIVRDDTLAKLADYESIVPTLLEHRFHLKHLTKTALKVVVGGLLHQLAISGKINLQEPELVTEKIADNLAGQKSNTGLACTQIYLHQTHQLSCGNPLNSLPVFSPETVDKAGVPETAIRSYIDKRIAELEKQLPDNQSGVLSDEHAREIEKLMEVQNFCGCPEAEARSMWLAKWFERGQRNRQIVWFTRLLLLALVGSVLALGFTYCSLANQAPCLLAEQAESCQERINYLCHNDADKTCVTRLTNILNEEACPIWVDYQDALNEDNCATYLNYIRKYQHQDVCVDKFYQILAERGCPTSVDTVTTVIYDTVYQQITSIERPRSFEDNSTIKNSPDCQEKFGKATVKLGPLFMMTSDLNNGTKYDWVGALAACKRLGPNWRLPCAGEIDFILDKHYQNAGSAYDNLTKGACPLVTEEEARLSGSFWTATEANDEKAWSIMFDSKNENVRLVTNTNKNTSMPCRCVYRDPTIASGIPKCLEKQVYRPNE